MACVLAAGAVLTTSAAAGAVPPAAAVKIRPNALVVDGGRTVVVDVSARCAPGLDVLEALVTVSQDDVSSDIGFFGATCDGKWHRFAVAVRAFEPTSFEEARARASAFLLVCDPSFDCSTGQDSKEVRLRSRGSGLREATERGP